MTSSVPKKNWSKKFDKKPPASSKAEQAVLKALGKESAPVTLQHGKPRGRPRKPAVDKRRGRVWDFTDWPHLFECTPEVRLAWYKNQDFKALMMAEEECPTTGQKHWQCRIQFRRAYRWEALKKIFPACVNFAISECTIDDNYYKKWESKCIYWEDNRQQGQRNVFKEQLEEIKKGANLRECAVLPGANGQSYKSAEIMMAVFEPKREYGDVKVIELDLDQLEDVHKHEGDNLYVPPYENGRLTYWTGYDAHEAVLIDAALHKVDAVVLRAWARPAPFLVNTKGGARQARFKRLYVMRAPKIHVRSNFYEPVSCLTNV